MVPVAMTGSSIFVAINEEGRRIGETHHNARIPDILVELIRDRYEYQGATCPELSRELAISINTIHKIVSYERRGQTVARWKAISL